MNDFINEKRKELKERLTNSLVQLNDDLTETIVSDMESFLDTALHQAIAVGRKEAQEEHIKDLYWLAGNLEDMYGRLGVGAVYDSIRDHAVKLVKKQNHDTKKD